MNFKVGDKVRCTHAETYVYKVGDIYDVVEHPKDKLTAIKAPDGYFDLVSLVLSKLEVVK